MAIGLSLILVAIGAVLVWAVGGDADGWASVDTVGWILIVVGAFGVLFSLFSWANFWGGFRRGEPTPREDRRV